MNDTELLDLIATAIVDGTDMDCTARDQAASVLRALREEGLVVQSVGLPQRCEARITYGDRPQCSFRAVPGGKYCRMHMHDGKRKPQ